jgi:hypothetical protein
MGPEVMVSVSLMVVNLNLVVAAIQTVKKTPTSAPDPVEGSQGWESIAAAA